MLMIDKFMKFFRLKVEASKSVEDVTYLTEYARTVKVTEVE